MATDTKIVVDELLVKPSLVVPTLYVGLGGAGGTIIRRVADHLIKRPDFEERYKPLAKFAFVDTNLNDMEKHREVANELFLISDFEKADYAALASGKGYLDADPYFTQWVPQNYRFRAGDTAGAGQIRIESRLGTYYQTRHGNLIPRFRRLFEDLKSHESGHRRLDVSEIRIVVCYSIAGGTGSGSHLQIAYLLRELAAQFGKPVVLGVAALPSVFERFIGTNKDGTFANGYAALKETEHLMKLGAPESRFFPEEGIEFHYNPADPSKKVVREKPFEWVYVIDRPESMAVDNVLDAAGDGLYLQLYSDLMKEQAGDYDNYTQHQRFLVPHDFEGKDIKGFTSFYGSYGSAVLHVPVGGLADYCGTKAVLKIMKESFLGEIDAGETYRRVQDAREEFFQVKREEDPKPVPEAEFKSKGPQAEAALDNLLFKKRVEMLAACEHEKDVRLRYSLMFRHGHPLGTTFDKAGKVAYGQLKQFEKDELKNVAKEFDRSIAHYVLNSLDKGRDGGDLPALLAAAFAKADEAIEGVTFDPKNAPKNPGAIRNLFERADALSDAKRILDAGDKDSALLGLQRFVGLSFLSADESPGVSLSAKRYAVLRLMDRLEQVYPGDTNKYLEPVEPPPAAIEKLEKSTSLGKDDAQTYFDYQRNAYRTNVHNDLAKHLWSRVKEDIVKPLAERANVYRGLQAGFPNFAAAKLKRLHELVKVGDYSTNRYVLDSEALQIESNRRLWDFYFEDEIAGHSDLTTDNTTIAETLSDSVKSFGKAGAQASSQIETLFKMLHKTVTAIVKEKIEGNIRAKDAEKKNGLTLQQALVLELEYRAAFLSAKAEIDADPSGAKVRQLVLDIKRNRQLGEQKIDLSLPVHQDYLRDKVKRVLKEKSDLLCYLDDKHLQQGGVRPDAVFLAIINSEYVKGPIADAIKEAGLTPPKFVTTGENNLREIVFYRAVLNVPLYVFGRMSEMKGYYHRFKKMARRSKVLHVDKNWEETLPDLDPADLEEEYRSRFVRDQVIDFTTLMSLPNGPDRNCIYRHEGMYYLWAPGEGDKQAKARKRADAVTDEALAPNPPVPLAPTLLRSIELLPSKLAAESVRFADVGPLLRDVRMGKWPMLLAEVARHPTAWKHNAENLRNRFGATNDPLKLEKIDDYARASVSLAAALKELLDKVRADEAERRATEEPSESEGVVASIKVLSTFVEAWEDRQRNSSRDLVPNLFGKVDDLDQVLARMRRGEKVAPKPDPLKS